MRLEPDKYRFADPGAVSGRHPVHAVDVSDGRSVRQFVTFWCKGPAAAEAFAARYGLPGHHDRAVYHRDPPWIPATFPGMESRGWSRHYHLDLDRPPAWADVAPFAADLPPAVLAAVREHLGG